MSENKPLRSVLDTVGLTEKSMENVKEAGDKLIEGISEKVGEGKEKLNKLEDETFEAISSAASGLSRLEQKAENELVKKLEEKGEKVDSCKKEVCEAISGTMNDLGEVRNEAAKKLHTDDTVHNIGDAVSELVNEGKEKIVEKLEEGKKTMQQLYGNVCESVSGVEKKIEEKMTGKVEEDDEKAHERRKEFEEGGDYLSKISDSVKVAAEQVSEKIMGTLKGSEELCSSNLGNSVCDKEALGERVEKSCLDQVKAIAEEDRSNDRLMEMGSSLNEAVKDMSVEIVEKLNKGIEFVEEKLHGEGGNMEKGNDQGDKKEEVRCSTEYVSDTDLSGMETTVTNSNTDIFHELSEKISHGREYLMEKLHEKGDEVQDRKSNESVDPTDFSGVDFAKIGGAVKELAGKLSEEVLENVNEAKEFLSGKISEMSEDKKQIVHEYMGGVYVKNENMNTEKEANLGHDFLGAADFGGLQSTMRDVFSKIAQQGSELPETGHQTEPPVVKKIIPEGENVPEQVGTLLESGVYHDDYASIEEADKPTTKLENFSGDLPNDQITKPDVAQAETECDILLEEDNVQHTKTEEAVVADKIGETFEKVLTNQYCIACKNRECTHLSSLEDKMESGDDKIERHQSEEEKPNLASSSSLSLYTSKQAEDLLGTNDQMIPSVPHYQESTDSMKSPTNYVDEKSVEETNQGVTLMRETPVDTNVEQVLESSTLEDTLKLSTTSVIPENTLQGINESTGNIHDETSAKAEINSTEEKNDCEHHQSPTNKLENYGGSPEYTFPSPIASPKNTAPIQSPMLWPKTAPPPVPPKKKSIEMILAEEAKALKQHSLRGSQQTVHETISVELEKGELESKDEATLRDKNATKCGLKIESSSEPSANEKMKEKDEELKREAAEFHHTKEAPLTSIQEPETPKTESQPSSMIRKPQEAIGEKSKTDTMKSQNCDGRQHQQQPVRRRCTIL